MKSQDLNVQSKRPLRYRALSLLLAHSMDWFTCAVVVSCAGDGRIKPSPRSCRGWAWRGEGGVSSRPARDEQWSKGSWQELGAAMQGALRTQHGNTAAQGPSLAARHRPAKPHQSHLVLQEG